MDYTNMTAEEIDNEKCKKEAELQEAQKSLSAIEVADLEIGKKIVLLQVQRKDLQIALSKAKQVVRTLALEIKIATSYFWKVKG